MELNKYEIGHFVWTPKHLRSVDKFGLAIPKGVYVEDNRVPLFWLKREGHDLYLINNSDFTIAVKAITYGFEKDVGVSPSKFYVYENVIKGEAAKIYEYDPILDSDFTLQTEIEITSNYLAGTITCKTPLKKGLIDEHVLLWDEDFFN